MGKKTTDKPNLIYVFADQLRYDALGCNGSKYAKTPRLDEIAEHCVCLDNAVSGHPVCAPYRASLFTGKYTTSTGMVINEIRINPNHRCFGHVLTDAGYETAYIGKWHLYAAQLGHHYDTKNSFVPPGPDRLGFDDLFAAYNFHHEYYAPKAYYHLNTNEKIYAEGYEPAFMTDYAMGELERLAGGDKPFAMFLSLGTPHDPWTPENVPAENLAKFADTEFKLPENYCEKNDPHADMWARLSKKERANLTEWMRVYYAMVNELDGNIGRIFAKVQELGIDDNTIFVFTSDHGEMFGAHGRRAKNIFYDEAVRVPFMIRYGGELGSGRAGFGLNTVDIMPTLLSMMGLEIPAEAEGRDKSSSLYAKASIDNSDCPDVADSPDNAEHSAGGVGSAECSEGIVGNAGISDGCLMMGTGPTAIYGNGREWRAYRTTQYTYAVYKKDGKEFLFDNIADPLQMNNLIYGAQDSGDFNSAGNCEDKNADMDTNARGYTEIRDILKNAMLEEMTRIGDDFPACYEYRRRWVKHRKILIDKDSK